MLSHNWEVVIVIPGEPCARKSHKVAMFKGKNGKTFRKPLLDPESASFQNLCGMAAQEAMAGRNPIDEPVFIDFTYVFSPPMSALRKNDKLMLSEGKDLPMKCKADGDNLMKNTLDGIKSVAITDDVLMYDWGGRKRIGLRPRTEVRIIRLSEIRQ